MTSRRDTGSYWEARAEQFLRSRGMTTLARNYHCRMGELDLIMRDGSSVVFVEVRFRTAAGRGSGAETVTPAKQRRISAAAGRFLMFNKRLANQPCRFDVVAFDSDKGRVAVNWIRGAFYAA